MNINTSIERITPAMAQTYMERNTNNRNIREKHVDKLASDISDGRWHMNGSSIVFNGDGTLLDGQHRLAAIIKSGVPVDMIVVRGVSKAAMATIDANISRKASDVAMLRGYTSTNQLIGTVRLLITVRSGIQMDGERASHGAIMEFLQKHPHVQDSTTAAFKYTKTIPVTSVAAWHYLAFYIGGQHEEVNAAMRVFETGIPNYPNDAIHVYRERALRDKRLMQGAMHRRLHGLWTLATAWNDFQGKVPRSICRIQQSEVKINGVDYDKL